MIAGCSFALDKRAKTNCSGFGSEDHDCDKLYVQTACLCVWHLHQLIIHLPPSVCVLANFAQVEPILEVLVGKTLELSVLELMEASSTRRRAQG